MHLKTEVYCQWLFKIPVIPTFPQESILNLGDEFVNDWDYVFVNEGTGRNYGAEVTLEKFFNKHYYFLLTASLYDSKYKGYDKIERNTRFAGNYALNGLSGYEWELGKRRLLSVNTKVSYMGGKRYVPENDYTQAYQKRMPAYFRLDLNMNIKTNYKRVSVELFFEVSNITNHQNIWRVHYNTGQKKYEYLYQLGFMPLGGCRVYF